MTGPVPTRCRAAALLVLALAVSGCARTPKAPVVVRPPMLSAPTPPPPGAHGTFHVVSKGETLYRISKTYHVDLSELMRLNGIQDPSQLEIGTRLFVPVPPPGAPPSRGPHSAAEVAKMVGRARKYPWQTITLHHSGTQKGDASHFHSDHLRRRMGGLFYHFVIGNGSYSRDGLIEVGWRWRQQKPVNRPNDIQICLVGNFQQQQVSDAQLSSLVQLVDALRREYGVPLSSVRLHKDIKGKHTECPGKNFPFHRVLTLLKENGGRVSA